VNGRSVERWGQVQRLLERNRGESLRISYLRPGPVLSGLLDLRLMTPTTTHVDPEARREGARTRYESGIYSAEFFVDQVEKGSPAEKIGLKPGDRVTGFNGRPLRYWELIHLTLEQQRKATHSITWVPYGGLERTASFQVAQHTYRDEYKQTQQRFVFGIKNHILTRAADGVPIDGRFTYAISKAVRETGQVVGVMALGFVQLFRGAIPRDTIGGPIMLFYTAGAAAEKGWDHYLWMMALISINLGILNLLPIPILDGGHIMFFSIEAVKRRPLSLRARELASYVGLVLLISLMVFAFKNDIVRYFIAK